MNEIAQNQEKHIRHTAAPLYCACEVDIYGEVGVRPISPNVSP